MRDITKQVSPNDPEGVEVANLVLFLCSDLAGDVTRAQYVVDGGRTAAPTGVSQGGVG